LPPVRGRGRNFGAAHTDGDAFIVFRGLRVMHAGDVFLGLDPPTVDVRNGGTDTNDPPRSPGVALVMTARAAGFSGNR
jgi:hypothetical protein